jgi:N-sulfoglucosamine sulfohydrolase
MTVGNKKRIHFLILTICLSFYFICSAQGDPESKGPNILLILADDLGWSDIGPYGNKDVKTPHLTKLASEGMKFYGMYTATAMCAPSRQQILTGMFPVRSGAYPNHGWSYQGVKSLPQYLRPFGYRVGISGKRHIGPPSSYPFEEVGNDRDITDADNLKAIEEFMTLDDDGPFALYVAAHQPHKPWDKGDPSRFDPNSLTVPPYLLDTDVTRNELTAYYAEIEYLDKQVGTLLEILEKTGKADNTLVIFTSEQGPQFPFAKWTCYENGLKTGFLVRWPGKVKSNTINRALVQYVDVVPTLLEVAGGNPDTVYTGRMDALGNQGFDGKSFLSVLLDNGQDFRKYVYGIHTTMGILNNRDFYPVRSIGDGRYKYIKNLNSEVEFSNISKPLDTVLYPDPKESYWWINTALMESWFQLGDLHSDAERRAEFYYRRPSIEFYDLDKDPHELKNIASDPDYKEKIGELDHQLKIWMAQQGDKGLLTEMEAMSRNANLIRAQESEK